MGCTAEEESDSTESTSPTPDTSTPGLSVSSTVSISGSVLDAALAYSNVTLKQVDSSTNLSDNVKTDITGA